MKQRRCTEEHIIGILKRMDAGQHVLDACRTHGMSEATYHRWTTTYSGVDVSEARRRKQLEDENRRLNQLVADLALDTTALNEVLGKTWERLPCDVRWWASSSSTSRCRSGGRVTW
jgi:putative transposase